MKKTILSLAMAAAALPSSLAPVPVAAQANHDGALSSNRDRDWRRGRDYDWNRPATRGAAYYADDYYRDGRYYRPYPISRTTRLYRGRDGRYYCRRDDGTTGLVVGASLGALVGAGIDRGRSNLAGVLFGGSAGALLGREIDRGGLSCR